jgi:hypothetical protein
MTKKLVRKHRSPKRKDPSAHEKPKFGASGTSGSLTMRVEAGAGLKAGPKVHPHKKRASKRTHRAK